MATAQEINEKNQEFQAAVVALETATVDYEAKKEPYLESKEVLIQSIATVDRLDNELEALIDEYEPPANPQPE